MKKLFTALALAGTTALTTGCVTTGAGIGSVFNSNDNTRVENRAENRGMKQYGSEACRSANVEVVPGRAYQTNRTYYRNNFGSFDRLFGSNNQFKQNYSVVSQNGQPYVLVSNQSESQLFTMAGMVGGAAVAAPNGRRGHNQFKDVAKTALGALAGGAIGSIADGMINGGAREAFDRCRLDVQQGAYDVQYQNGPYQNQQYQQQQPQYEVVPQQRGGYTQPGVVVPPYPVRPVVPGYYNK